MTARTAAQLKANFQGRDPQDQNDDVADTIYAPVSGVTVTDLTANSITGGDASLDVTGITGTGTGDGGAVPITGGVSGDGATGTGGAVSLTGGAAASTNGAGGATSSTGGAGRGTGAGGASSLLGGPSGTGATGNGGVGTIGGGIALSTNGNGGASSVTGGAASGTGTGGSVTIISGASAGAGGTAGAVSIDTGAASGGTGDDVTIGNTNALAINLNSVAQLGASGGADSANALLIGKGTSANPATTSTAGKVFLELRTQSTATSGDSRGGYFRHELKGAGGSGESVRANTNLGESIASNTAHGVHGSVAHQTGSTVTGLSVGVRGGWILPDAAVGAGGTYYGGLSEIFTGGDSSTPAAVAKYAVHEFSIGGSGNAAAQNTVKNFLSFTFGGTDGTGNAVYSHDHAAGNAAGSIRILVNGGVQYLKFWAAE